MTPLPDSRYRPIPGRGHSSTSPFLPVVHVRTTDEHRSPFPPSGPSGGVWGLFTGNGHALPEGIIPHFITGLGGSCWEGKEAAPFWNSAPFSSEQRCLSLSAWASASFSTILMNLNLALSAKHERRPSPLLRVTLFCCATAQDSLTDASQKSRPHSVPWTAGNLPYTRA